ncbi:hypothetical protein SSX86_023915 [Deinandra increscens subsp. villosa]|uniref:Uncharacterized protein n=1 Tax=Deinandra increscens subsp. villosa TaxID=3103831 RepID=A0AAP0CKE7_9ASTR
MVVSFKISRIGSRFRPKPRPEPPFVPEHNDDEVDAPAQLPKLQFPTALKRSVDNYTYLFKLTDSDLVASLITTVTGLFWIRVDVAEDDCIVAESSEAEVSFILNIFPDGYNIVNPSESNNGHQNAVQSDPKFLRPYDRRSESLIAWDFFSSPFINKFFVLKAIECGHLPVDFLDDVHCNYRNGTVLCEVRDYQEESSESEVNDSLTDAFPSITKLSLKMSLDNLVKDIHLIADSTWEYGDLLEAESRILHALQPKLCLDPTPNLDRLCKEPTSVKLNLDIRGKRLKRLRQASAPENSNSSVGDSRQVTGQPDLVNLVDQNVCQSNMVVTGPKYHAPQNSNSRVRKSRQVTGQPDLLNPVDQNVGQSNMVTTRPTNHVPENSNMRVGNLRWITGQPDFVNLIDQNVGQSNMIATRPKKHAQDASSSVSHQSSHRISVGNLLNMQDHANDTHSSSIMSSVNDKCGNDRQVFSMVNVNKRSRSTHMGLDGNQHIDNINARKYCLKNTQVQQPLTIQQINDRFFNQYDVEKEPVKTEKINKFEPNRLHQRDQQQFTRANFNKAPWNNMSPNLENNTVRKVFSSGSGGLQFGAGATSVHVVGETRSSIFSANESTQQAQMAANWRPNTLQKAPVISGLESSSRVDNMIGPFTSSCPVDRSLQDRFSKIKMLTARFKLNCKKNKTDEYKPTGIFATQQLEDVLINDHDDDVLEDETCKMPLSMSLMGGNINICKTRVLNFVQNELPLPENVFLAIPKFHTRLILSERQSDGTVAMHLGEVDGVDYLAEDELLPSLPNTILRDGYQLAGDHLKPKPINVVQSSGGQSNTSPKDFNHWLQQLLKGDPMEIIYTVDEPSIDGASHHDMHPQRIGLSPGVSTTRMHPHIINSNNRESQLQNQFLQQQKQSQFQWKMRMRTDGMGHSIGGGNNNNNNNNSMARFQGLGMGGDGLAGTAAVSSMMSQNPMATKLGMGQNKRNRSGGLVRQSSNSGGLLGPNRQIHLGSGLGSGSSGVSMLGSGTVINRANAMNPMQRNVMAPPHLLPGLNPNQKLTHYTNWQQSQLIKQEPTSHLQAVISPSQQVGSPSPSVRSAAGSGSPPSANCVSLQNLDVTLI